MSSIEAPVTPVPSRQERRKSRTRDAIVQAARELLVAEGPEVSIQAITERADVAIGSFYNHFDSKQDAFVAVALDVLAEFEADLAVRTTGITDPAEVPCVGVRLILRLPETHPEAAEVFVAIGSGLPAVPRGYSPMFERDIKEAITAGRLHARNLQTLMLMVAGGYQRLLTLRLLNPDVGPEIADEFAQTMLEMFGMPSPEAKKLAHKKLPPESGATKPRQPRTPS